MGVIAHSFGAYIAVEYANRYPDVVERMVLECPTFDTVESFRSVVQKAEPLYRQSGQNQTAERCKDAYSLSVSELGEVFNEISDKRDLVYLRTLNPDFF
ncbi:hypothetical protein GCM10025859_24950 [Alicyclobacillus fastidiosus]|nr:hypothetical protein GCM10025859_24950 [Alicyclobacillus fastidiosus]